ncbi:probable carboxylesterase 15 isoform X2 [Cryptomeria japonica]|uniref:probable carboxylesterase 15 isoform X2 n=1 Tax=Cryptomeria japonica TaxID=3369 RepID=UPI0027DA12ED|nr:probable carboxylesterase 15 isoform X2 [Cryptomeria japonica]
MRSCTLRMSSQVEKKLVDEVSGWLKLFSDGSVERTWTGADEVKPLITAVPPSNDTFIDGVATKHVAVDEENGVWIRIYLPRTVQNRETHNKLGVAIHFKGGGFCVSHADWQMYNHIYSRFVTASNVICVSVDYRLAPEHRLPAAIDDCFAAVAWLGKIARGEKEESWLTQHADFDRCVLIGDSAGGNLVHQVAVRAVACEEELRPLCLRGCVALHPGFVRSERSKSELEVSPDSALLTLEMVDKFLGLGLPVGSTKDHPITNPMGAQSQPLDKVKFPPFLVGVAERDLMRDTQMEYCEAMRSAGHEVEIVVSEKVIHRFISRCFAR